MQEHTYAIDVEGTPEEVWQVFWAHRSGTRSHEDVTIEVLHPGDTTGEGLVRHCRFPVPRWLLSGGQGVSWEWLTEVNHPESWRYDNVGKPLWSRASGNGLYRLESVLVGLDLINTSSGSWEVGSSARWLLPRATVLAYLWSKPADLV